VKLFPVLKSKAGNEVSPLRYHASKKFTLVAPVPSVEPAGNVVKEEVPCHAESKLVESGALTGPIVVILLQFSQAYAAVVAKGNSVFLNSTISKRFTHGPLILLDGEASAAPLSIKSFRASSISAPVALSGKSIIP
jgi:hypothetical protein